ncbi:MAG TPA: hypothetical protein VG455_12175 [Acidimicrobiales bacterium]|nr:hypothetical protein [Acidimicrobiales bacterium]
MTEPLLVAFVAGFDGQWLVEGIRARAGEPLAPAARLAIVEGAAAETAEGRWVLRGVVAGQGEDARADQLPLGRPEARCAVLVAVRMAPAWWQHAEDDRRALSANIEHGPTISRRIHRARNRDEPFDVLTWFEFAPDQQAEVDEMVARLREAEEWSYVERDVEVRLIR